MCVSVCVGGGGIGRTWDYWQIQPVFYLLVCCSERCWSGRVNCLCGRLHLFHGNRARPTVVVLAYNGTVSAVVIFPDDGAVEGDSIAAGDTTVVDSGGKGWRHLDQGQQDQRKRGMHAVL